MLQYASSFRLSVVLCEDFSWVCIEVRLLDQTKRPDHSLLHGAVLCIAGCLVASVYPPDISSVTPAPDETIKCISKHYQMAPVGQNSSPLRTIKIGMQIVSVSATICRSPQDSMRWNSYQQCKGLQTSLPTLTFLILANLMSIKWYLTLVLICVSLNICKFDPL